ncbi:MAG: DoxX family protein [Devosia sp.]
MEILSTLNFYLWAAQGLLAALFGMAGAMKAFRPIPDLSKSIDWAAEFPVPLTRFIGISELLGAIGLILPIATGILPGLTPLAAIGLAVIQVLAIGFHVRRGEMQIVPANFVLLALAVFVAWGRWSLFGF